ncbi:MAG: hypothetical protein ACM3S0_12855 [Acidobacteriota bacterium]
MLILVVLASRLYLLRVYDVELSQDGFEAVRTLSLLQAQGAAAVPRDLLDRFILHPLYMLLLYAWRVLIPASFDFYLAARFLSALLACVAVILLFELVKNRHAFGEPAAWAAALFLAFAPSFLWESISILSSTLFLALYLAVLLALVESRYRAAALLAFLSAITRYEGIVLLALVGFALLYRDRHARTLHAGDWVVFGIFALAFPATLMAGGWLATGNAFEFIGAQSMAAIWLRFMAPGDFLKHASFFITQYPQLFPWGIVALGIAGTLLALARHRHRATALLLATSLLYVLFFELLVWLNYTTLEVRFLMYPGLPLLVFAGVALAEVGSGLARLPKFIKFRKSIAAAIVSLVVLALLVASYQQGSAGMQFLYNMMASQREMADELSRLVPPDRQTNLMVYTGNSGALDLFGRQHGLRFTFVDFRYAPDDAPEQFLLDRQIQLIVYPVGNAFAKIKYPYLARFETQTHGAVTFQPLVQFATSTDNQLYSIWSVSAAE